MGSPTSTVMVDVGTLGPAFGIKGEVKVICADPDPKRYLGYGTLMTPQGRTLQIAGARRHKGGLLLRFEGIADRTQAEGLRGLVLQVPRDALPPEAEDEYYYADLVGLLAESTDGTPLGVIGAVYDFGAGDLLEITQRPDGQKPVMVPFTQDYVPEVFADRVRIAVVPGLLD